jgi:hypothetical protein
MLTQIPLKVRMSPRPEWFGDEDNAALIDVRSGRVYGHYWHDGYGKWHPVVCLSHWRAWRVIRTQPAFFWGFASLTRCWVQMVRSKSRDGAEAAIEEFVPPVFCIIERDIPEELDDGD